MKWSDQTFKFKVCMILAVICFGYSIFGYPIVHNTGWTQSIIFLMGWLMATFAMLPEKK